MATTRAVALSGTMAAGKSTVSGILQAEHGFTALAFGDVVRAEADIRGISRTDRAALQTLGQSLFRKLGANGLVDRLLQDASGDVVIDGIRHIAVLEHLRTRLPGVLFGFLYADQTELDHRWQLRDETASRSLAASHEVEAEINELHARADITFNAATLTPASIAAMLSAGVLSQSSD